MMNAIQSFEDLDVWKKAHQLVLGIYRLTVTFPDHEKFGLVSQMRRCAVSVPANIAEGFKRRGMKDKAHFYNIAQGSLEELHYYLILARDLHYLQDISTELEQADHIGRMLNSLINSILQR